jgi:hypothetical protein
VRGSGDRARLVVRLGLGLGLRLAQRLALRGLFYELQESGEYFGCLGFGSLHAGVLD